MKRALPSSRRCSPSWKQKHCRNSSGHALAPERLIARRQAAMRYRGQSYEVSVDLATLAQAAHIEDLIARFHAAHQRRYGHMAQAEAVEIVNFQVTAIGTMPRPRRQKLARVGDAQ